MDTTNQIIAGLREWAQTELMRALPDILSYNVGYDELMQYATNQINICEASYELQCAVCDLDPASYRSEMDAYMNRRRAEKRVEWA